MATIDVKDAAGTTQTIQQPNANGQAVMASSRPVVIASDQSAIKVQHAARTTRGRQVTTITGTSETTIVTAGSSGVFRDLFMLLLTNSSATATVVTIKDATAGTTVMTLAVPAGQTVGYTLPACDAARQSSSANNWTATLGTSVTSLFVSAFYVEN